MSARPDALPLRRTAAPGTLVRATMFTSDVERCGVADYSRALVAALAEHLTVQVVPAGGTLPTRSSCASIATALNGGQVAHLQHTYGFWGGMRPRRAGLPDLLAALRVPVAMTVHEIDGRATGAHHLPRPLELAYKRWFNRRNLADRRIGAWFVHAEGLRDALCRLGAPPDRVHMVPMPVPRPAGPLPDPEWARHQLGLAGRRVLTIPGFLVRRKGYDLALEALARLGPDHVLLCAGGEHAADGTGTEQWLRDRARALGVADRLVITGYVPWERIPQVMAASDLVLAPFREMAGSASVTLSLAHHAPVLASDLPPNRALPCVALFPTGDSAALAAHVARLLSSPGERLELQARAARFARDHGFEALAERTLAIYEQLLAR